MQINLSIVSHGHFDLIKRLGCLKSLSHENGIEICIVDNLAENGFEDWCEEFKIGYVKNNIKCGFGENNNKAFEWFKSHKKYASNSYFIVINPDVVIDVDQLIRLYDIVSLNSIEFACINLFKDKKFQNFDNSIRKYPSFKDFIASFIFSKNDTIIDKSTISEPVSVDWASGSFLLFKPELYEILNGFDEKYYMYCEDIDICMRANYLHGRRLVYIPNVHAIHYAAHNNRKIFSKHFVWHVQSLLRYLYKKFRLALNISISNKSADLK